MRHGHVRRESLLYVVRGRHTPNILRHPRGRDVWLTAGVCPRDVALPRRRTQEAAASARSRSAASARGSLDGHAAGGAVRRRCAWTRCASTFRSGSARRTRLRQRRHGLDRCRLASRLRARGRRRRRLRRRRRRHLHALDAATGAGRWTSHRSAGPRGAWRCGGLVASLVAAPARYRRFDADRTASSCGSQRSAATRRPRSRLSATRAVRVAADGRVVALGAGRRRESAGPARLTGARAAALLAAIASSSARPTTLLLRSTPDSGSATVDWRTGGDVIGTAADATRPSTTPRSTRSSRAVNPGNGHQRWKRDAGTRPGGAAARARRQSCSSPGLSPALSVFAPQTGAPSARSSCRRRGLRDAARRCDAAPRPWPWWSS